MKCPYWRICKGKRRHCPGTAVRGAWQHCILKDDIDRFIETKLRILREMGQ